MRDLVNNLLSEYSLCQVVTTAVDGVGKNLTGYEGALAVLAAGILGGTSTPTLTFKLQESDVLGSGYTDVADIDIVCANKDTIVTPFGTVIIVAATDELVHVRGYRGTKTFLRWICSAASGTSPTAPICGLIVKGFPRSAPVS